MARGISAVLVGYAIFALTTAVLFWGMERNPHGHASAWFILGSVAYGTLTAGLSGYATAALARRTPVAWASGLGLLIASVAGVSLVLRGGGSLWHPLSALLIMAPAAVVGGRLRARRADRLLAPAIPVAASADQPPV